MSRLSILLIVLGIALQFGMGQLMRRAAKNMGWVEGVALQQLKR